MQQRNDKSMNAVVLKPEGFFQNPDWLS